MGENTKTLLCMDVMNWLSEFWKGDIEIIMRDPWKALRSTDEAVGEFVQAARASNFDVIVVIGSDAKTDQAWQTWRSRRENEICEERRGMCMGANIFLLEAFEKHGVRVVRPSGADPHNVLAAMAVAKSGIVLSRDRGFFYYNVRVKVCRDFSVFRGNLRLGPILTRDPSRYRRNISRVIQPDLASLEASASPEHEWTKEIVTKYRPSLMNGAVFRGTSGSSDKLMGNLHVLARPLRAAVYSILGEQVAVEKMPEWSGVERKVTWKVTQVLADPAHIPVLKTPQAVAAWLVERDARVPPQFEPWRATERLFNTCAIASEMVVVSSQGGAATTMHECMELLSKELPNLKSKSPYHSQLPSSQNSGSNVPTDAGDGRVEEMVEELLERFAQINLVQQPMGANGREGAGDSLKFLDS